TVDPRGGNGYYDTAYLDRHAAVYEDERVRVVKFDTPPGIAINGRSGLGVIVKPEYNEHK
ncbi:MAG: hypothetical protein K2K22_05590, partial [Muribaculaceae bacterium]|nr:hypothetical protein [Muribaculaceae bacterium]